MQFRKGLILLAALAPALTQAQKLGTVELGGFVHYTKVQSDPLLGDNSVGGGLRGGIFLMHWLEVETEYGIGGVKGDSNIRYPKGKWYPERVFLTGHIPMGSRYKLMLGIGHNDTWKGDITYNAFEEGLSALAGVGICMGDSWYLRPEIVYDRQPVKGFHQGFEIPIDAIPGTAERSTRWQFRLGISRFFLRGTHSCMKHEAKPAPVVAPPPAPAPAPPPPPAAPTASLSASPSSITAGQTSTLSWSSSNATSCSAPWMSGGSTTGRQTVSPTSTTNYTVSCTGAGGLASASASVSVSAPPPPPPPPTPAAPPRELYQLLGVNFDFDKSIIKPVGKARLDSAIVVLNQFPDMNVEIQGHTDWVGTDEYNQGLSERRAKAVFDYLVSKGVSARRLTTKGYGEKVPIATNDTAEGRALNRRVMIIELRK